MWGPLFELKISETRRQTGKRNERFPHRKQTPEVPQRICQTALWVSAENRYMKKLDLIYVPARSAIYFN